MHALLTLSMLLAAAAEPEPTRSLTLQELFNTLTVPTPAAPPKGLPRDATLAAVSWVGTVVADEDGRPLHVVFTSTTDIEVHATDPWVRVPLFGGEAALLDAQIGGRPVSVVRERTGLVLTTDRRGRFRLDLRFVVPVDTYAGASSFSLPVAPAGASRLSLTLPGTAAMAFDAPDAATTSQSTTDRGTHFEATFPGGTRFTVVWQEADPPAPTPDEARVHARVDTIATLADGLIASRAYLDHTIRARGTRELRYRVPEGYEVVEVDGEGVRTWSVQGDVLDVSLRFDAEGDYPLEVALERPVTPDLSEVAAPLLHPLDGVRVSGQAGLVLGAELEATFTPPDGGAARRPTDPTAALRARTREPLAHTVQYAGDPGAMRLRLTHLSSAELLAVRVDKATATTTFTSDGHQLTHVVYEVRKLGPQPLRLRLPEGAQLWHAEVNHKPTRPTQAEGDTLHIQLPATSTVSLTYATRSDGADHRGRMLLRGELPELDAPVAMCRWTLQGPSSARASWRGLKGNLQRGDGERRDPRRQGWAKSGELKLHRSLSLHDTVWFSLPLYDLPPRPR